jgi:phosphohistidine phosphatase
MLKANLSKRTRNGLLPMRAEGPSRKLRALQTAEILARHLNASDRVQSRTGLAPLDDVEPIRKWLVEQSHQGYDSIALVGHLPFLDKLASLLVAGNETAEVVAFQNACVVKLIPKKQSEGHHVNWILTPDMVTEQT